MVVVHLINCNKNIKESDDDDEKDENVVIMEGYLRKKSLYLKQLRQRYIVIKSNYSCLSYKDHNKLDLTETIDLSQFDEVRISEDGSSRRQFELIQSNDCNKKRVFVADSMKDLDEWYNAFKLALNDQNDDATMLYQSSRRYDYWSDARLEPKYESIKEEVTSNRIYSISMNAFDAALSKAKHLINNSAQIKNMTVYRGVTEIYNLRYDATPKIDHILALILWTDYRILAKEFAAYFTKV